MIIDKSGKERETQKKEGEKFVIIVEWAEFIASGGIYNFDLNRYGWHSTDYQGVLLTVARVRSATPRYSINQLGCRCQQRCLNSSHVIRQQRSWTANVELPRLSNIYSPVVKIDGRIVLTIRRGDGRRTGTDINRAKLTRDLFLSFFLFFLYLYSSFFLFPLLFLSPRARPTFFLAHMTAQRWNLRYLDTVRKTIIYVSYIYTRDKFYPLDDVPSFFFFSFFFLIFYSSSISHR